MKHSVKKTTRLLTLIFVGASLSTACSSTPKPSDYTLTPEAKQRRDGFFADIRARLQKVTDNLNAAEPKVPTKPANEIDDFANRLRDLRRDRADVEHRLNELSHYTGSDWDGEAGSVDRRTKNLEEASAKLASDLG